jgi:hypothetical protein
LIFLIKYQMPRQWLALYYSSEHQAIWRPLPDAGIAAAAEALQARQARVGAIYYLH